MKNRLILTLFVLSLFSVTFYSCSEDDDPIEITVKLNQTSFEYDEEGVWKDVATNTQVSTSQNLIFAHQGEMTPWGLSWYGFTPARTAATAGEILDYQFNVPAAGGMDGEGTPYFVASWNTQENETTALEDRTCRVYYSSAIEGVKELFNPQYVYVCNTSYTYYRLTVGDQWSRKFVEGDYFVLTAHGVHSDGTESTTDFYLADCRSADSNEWVIVNEWTKFDLTPLGEVSDVYFSLSSSDNGQWGMNTPAFFGIDWLSIVAPLPQE